MRLRLSPRSSLCSLVLLATVLVTACGGGGASGGGGDTAPKPPTGDAASGEALYASLGCKGCHGLAGEKGNVGPDLFAMTWDDHERGEARETILKGEPDHKPPMPAYEGKVDDQKIADLLAYIAKK